MSKINNDDKPTGGQTGETHPTEGGDKRNGIRIEDTDWWKQASQWEREWLIESVRDMRKNKNK